MLSIPGLRPGLYQLGHASWDSKVPAQLLGSVRVCAVESTWADFRGLPTKYSVTISAHAANGPIEGARM